MMNICNTFRNIITAVGIYMIATSSSIIMQHYHVLQQQASLAITVIITTSCVIIVVYSENTLLASSSSCKSYKNIAHINADFHVTELGECRDGNVYNAFIVYKTGTEAVRARNSERTKQIFNKLGSELLYCTGLQFRTSTLVPVAKVITGDFDATMQSIGCPQTVTPVFDIGLELDEDCLTLDVFVPETAPPSAAVMVWIHGGGFASGTGSIPKSMPTPLAAMNDVIVVTFNYRIGVLGFIGTGDEEFPFNTGLMDQRMALMWVQQNIAAFGGDPTRVTIFGESAGGVSVGFHVLSPLSSGLFESAIMQSGTPSIRWSYTSAEKASKMTFKFGEVMNCSVANSAELVTCLRKIPSDVFINYFTKNPMAAMQFTPRPVVDGKFVPRNPLEMYNAGEINKANVMIGCGQDEGNVFLLMEPMMAGGGDFSKPTWNKTTFDGTLMMFFELDQLTADIAATVFLSPEEMAKDEPDYADAGAAFMGDEFFLCSTFDLSEKSSAVAGNPTYTYLMTYQPSGSMWGPNLNWTGATHGEDLPYMFGSPFLDLEADPERDYSMRGSFNEEEVEMSKQIMKYWANFAKSGNPNLSSKDGEPDSTNPVWSPFTKENPAYKDLSKTFPTFVGHPYPRRCLFILDLLPKLRDNQAELARLRALAGEDETAAPEGASPEGVSPEGASHGEL